MDNRFNKTERERPNRLPTQAEPKDFPPGVCGSCHWSQAARQFNVEKMACVALPRQGIAVGTQIMFVAPVIDNPMDRCRLWEAHREETKQ